jgi:hypothetical protein
VLGGPGARSAGLDRDGRRGRREPVAQCVLIGHAHGDRHADPGSFVTDIRRLGWIRGTERVVVIDDQLIRTWRTGACQLGIGCARMAMFSPHRDSSPVEDFRVANLEVMDRRASLSCDSN